MARDTPSAALLLLLLLLFVAPPTTAQRVPQGTVQAAVDVLERQIPGSSAHFTLSFFATSDDGRVTRTKAAPAKAQLWDCDGGKVCIAATTASELTAGIGWYLRERCNMTFGWPRGGGNSFFTPAKWPVVGATADAPIVKQRILPWSYIMNVCTHSYSLQWYGWGEWTQFIDWMALSGINQALAMTGQEEVQYKVFQQFGLNDTNIRTWFNGPAFLTWSRGQNEYGSNVAGPLPRSFMKDQWALQKQILARYRSLGIVGQLPGFQGNVPWALAAVQKDTNITHRGSTGWLTSTDPLFGKIADVWMQTLIADFGTDHWYQMDGYFNGGTAPWAVEDPYPEWYARGAAAYAGLNRTDPDAIWSFQGWAIVGWKTWEQGRSFQAFVDAAPKDRLVVIDMSTDGTGGFNKWNDSSFFGTPFIWTSLHDFGGTDAMKGDLQHANAIPFAHTNNTAVGTGTTPEGIDQNPMYYDFLIEQNFRTAMTANMTDHIVTRAHRRYQLAKVNPDVARAWALLVKSTYSQDVSVQDLTGIPHLKATRSVFEADRHTPKAMLCDTFNAWGALLGAAAGGGVPAGGEPLRYDLVNLGREVLAQLTAPVSQNFSDAVHPAASAPLDAARVNATGRLYVALLEDIDALVATDTAFLVGPWLAMARALGSADPSASDCGPEYTTCADFMEWNARCQITTWTPTPAGALNPGGPNDYAGKHWNGLIKDYYAGRVRRLLQLSLDAAAHGAGEVDKATVNKAMAEVAHAWQQPGANGPYPTGPQGDYVAVSQAMYDKYKGYFATCRA